MSRSRIAEYLKLVRQQKRMFPDNPDWDKELRIVASFIIAGDDQGFSDWIDRELFGEN